MVFGNILPIGYCYPPFVVNSVEPFLHRDTGSPTGLIPSGLLTLGGAQDEGSLLILVPKRTMRLPNR